MAKPGPKPKMRISGAGYNPDSISGRAAIQHLKYCRQNPDSKLFEIDADAIKAICESYISLESRQFVRKIIRKGISEEYIDYRPISRQGLRRALNISRQCYDYWLRGYVSATDEADDAVGHNDALMAAMRAGDDAIMQYLAEDGDSSDMQRRIRLLESYGEIGPAQSRHEIAGKLDLGKWGKWGK